MSRPTRVSAIVAAVAAVVSVAAGPVAAADLGSTAPAPSVLSTGNQLVSDDGAFTLTVQDDGNVVERHGATAVWSTNTDGHAGAVLDVQTDGNLVVRTSTGQALWSSGTPGRHGVQLALYDSGKLVMQSESDSWDNGLGKRMVLAEGESLRTGTDDQALNAPLGRYTLNVLQGLHIVEYSGNTAYSGHFEVSTWTPGQTSSSTLGNLTLQTDGNLVYRDTHGVALWASTTRGAGLRLTMQDDGNCVLRRPDGSAVWSTGTGRNLLGWGEFAPAGTRFVINASRGLPVTTVLVQTDGNVVRRGSDGRPLWTTNTAGNPGAQLSMQVDGNLVVRRPDGRVVWKSDTFCGRPTYDAGRGWIYSGPHLGWTETGGANGVC